MDKGEHQMPSFFYGWIILAILSVVNFAIQANGMFNLGLFVIPMCSDIGISRSLFGWLATTRSLSGGISVFILGRLVDRLGSRILIPCSALVTGLCMICIGASNHIKYLFPLFSIIGFAGLATAGGGILTTVPVAKWFVRRRGLAMGISTLGVGVGAVTFIPVTQFFINVFGWRKAWIMLAIIIMSLIIPLASVLLRRQPEDMGLLPDGVSKTDGVAHAQSNVKDEAIWTVSDAIHTRAFWLLNAAWMLWGLPTGGAIHRMAYWIEMGFDAQLVSFVFTIDAVGFTIMILAAGFLLDRFPPRFVQAGAFVGVIFSLTLMLVASHTYHMLFSVIFFGLSAGTNIVAQTYLWANYYGRTFLGAIRGVTLPVYLAAMAIGAPLTGYIYDYTGGYQPAWKLFIGVYFAGLLCMLAAKPPLKNSLYTHTT
jgi:MFS family permease